MIHECLVSMLTLKRECERLKTFNNLTIDHRKAHKFAKSGFFYTNLKDLVKCYFCSLEMSAFNSPIDIETEHLRLSPDCVYAGGKDVCGPYDAPLKKSAPSKLLRYFYNLLKVVLITTIITVLICEIYKIKCS